jgi:GNAT superfamily N-acetyltransferase
VKYRAPELLESRHQIDTFTCGSVEQTDWLRHHARQSVASGATKVLIVTPANSNAVVAYYAWTMAQIESTDAPPRLLKGAGRYPQPVALLARLGVHEQHEGKGLGVGLVQDVLRRVAAISDEIGCRGLLVHVESDRARGFYQHLIPEFEQSPTDDLHLILLLKDIKRTLRA